MTKTYINLSYSISTKYPGDIFLSLQAAGRPKKLSWLGHMFFNITNVFCAKRRVGHACICPRMVTG